VMVVGGFFGNVPRHLYEHRKLGPGEAAQNMVLEFDPRPATEMLVACVWTGGATAGRPGPGCEANHRVH
jgi:hypothetical protein